MNKKIMLAVMMAAVPGAALAAGGAELNGLRAADLKAQEGVFIPMPELEKSNYPVDYGYQKVHVVNRGPAVLATVGSGMMDTRLIIGYKKSGILGGAEKITARVMVSYYGGDGRTKLSTRDIELGKEWHGTGFMTPAMIHENYITLADNLGFRGIQKIELAFFANGQWDSNYDNNYTVDMNELSSSGIQYSNPGWAGSDDVAPACWDFIVGQMRERSEKKLNNQQNMALRKIKTGDMADDKIKVVISWDIDDNQFIDIVFADLTKAGYKFKTVHGTLPWTVIVDAAGMDAADTALGLAKYYYVTDVVVAKPVYDALHKTGAAQEKSLSPNSFLDSAVRLSRMHSGRLKTVAMAVNGQAPEAYTRGVADASFGIEGALYGMEEAIRELDGMALRTELMRMERFTARLHKLAASIAGTPDYTRLSGYEVESVAAALDAQLLIIRANACAL
ncbi:MAG: hypothetical protein M0011_03850 [Elusimicrobia bacterium]|nr:hypothetical protein [Elusimicrobiota bacterium]